MFKRRAFAFGLFAVALAIGLYSTHVVLAQGIGQVRVVASPHSYGGPCPARIKFTGTIEVDRYPMSLNIQWERSDGVRGATRVVRVPNAHTRRVIEVDHWDLGVRGQRMEVWEKLRVRSGNADVTSDAATVTVRCH